MIISNEVKMLCAKNMEAAEGGARLCDDYQWDDLWDKMLAQANIFEKIYMIYQGRKGIKVRTKAQVMSACINGFAEPSTKTLVKKAAPVQKAKINAPYISPYQNAAADPWQDALKEENYKDELRALKDAYMKNTI